MAVEVDDCSSLTMLFVSLHRVVEVVEPLGDDVDEAPDEVAWACDEADEAPFRDDAVEVEVVLA